MAEGFFVFGVDKKERNRYNDKKARIRRSRSQGYGKEKGRLVQALPVR
jgi:hypothetical protein